MLIDRLHDASALTPFLAGMVILLVGVSALLLHDHARLKRRIRTSEHYFRQILGCQRDMLLVIDPVSQRLVDANHTAETTTGYSRDELLGMVIGVSHGSTSVPEHKIPSLFEQSFGPRGVYRLTGRGKDGTPTPVEVAAGVVEVDGRRLLVGWARDRSIAIQIERRLRESDRQVREAGYDAMARLADAISLREHQTGVHSRRVASYATLIGHQLSLSVEEVDDVRRAARLHDIGKIAIPDAILLKPGDLDAAEWEVMRSHCLIGADLVAGLRDFHHIREMILSHHETWNGSGYPRGLARDHIPMGSRIIAVADAFDAMAHHRPYRGARPFDLVIAEIQVHSGEQFDPDVVAALVAAAEPIWQDARYASAGEVVQVVEQFMRALEDGRIRDAAALCADDVNVEIRGSADLMTAGRVELLREIDLRHYEQTRIELSHLRFLPERGAVEMEWWTERRSGVAAHGSIRVEVEGDEIVRIAGRCEHTNRADRPFNISA